MTVAEYLVDFLIERGVTDAFGLPGGVILDLLYTMDKSDKLKVHLNYHEQSAAFAAIGYAQASGKLGVAYATRGPGFTNLLTGVAEAYCDSIPVLFITAHEHVTVNKKMRIEYEQELDTVSIVSSITKYAKMVERVDEVEEFLLEAYHEAMHGRKGAVLLDFNSSIFSMEMPRNISSCADTDWVDVEKISIVANEIIELLRAAARPVLLLGDGIKQAHVVKEVREFAESNNLPVVSSRFAEDIMVDSELYYGYIGSHGVRYANFVLSKADLIIAMGNRMAFPLNSMSYRKTLKNKKIVRIEIDNYEFMREIPYCINYNIDLKQLFSVLSIKKVGSNIVPWIEVCNELKSVLYYSDVTEPINKIADEMFLLKNLDAIVCDVGNNEFWMSRAYLLVRKNVPIIYSKSFGSLGSGLGRAIGVYFATKKPVYCFVGDQGFQLNTQELQFIAQYKLPICIVVLNNQSSGMIRTREKNRYTYFLHTTFNSGYSCPDIKKIAEAYNLPYDKCVRDIVLPCVIEWLFEDEEEIVPNLQKGQLMQNLSPLLESNQYDYLDNL